MRFVMKAAAQGLLKGISITTSSISSLSSSSSPSSISIFISPSELDRSTSPPSSGAINKINGLDEKEWTSSSLRTSLSSHKSLCSPSCEEMRLPLEPPLNNEFFSHSGRILQRASGVSQNKSNWSEELIAWHKIASYMLESVSGLFPFRLLVKLNQERKKRTEELTMRSPKKAPSTPAPTPLLTQCWVR